MLLLGPDLHCAVPLALWRFSQYLSAKYRSIPKKSHHLSSGPLAGTAPYFGKSGSGYCTMLMKTFDEGLRLQPLGQIKLLISPRLYI